MRLSKRLLISHGIAPIVLTLALALALTALLRVGLVLSKLDERELDTLHKEGELHTAAWQLDVAMRHALISCAKGEPNREIRRAVGERLDTLRALATHEMRFPAPMREVVHGYLNAAEESLSSDTCETLHASAMQVRRANLDEQLTDLWVDRLGDLHRAVTEQESEARRIALSALGLGIPLAIASFILAMWIARRLARVLEEPLQTLARAAQRVGRGDFTTPANVVSGPPEILALAQDIDKMRLELQQLEALKQGFLASVSHELRTPLSKIREGLALLGDGTLGQLDDKKLRVVQIARAACEREIRMVTTLLDLSRLRAGSPVRLKESTSIDGLLYAAIDGERGEAQQRGVQIELIAEGEAGQCRLDGALMERAIANLVRNAVAVSARGQTVTVQRTIETTPAKPQVRVLVRDQGPGVPLDIRSKLFDAFVTRPVPNSGKSFGSGIGLALAREVARAHGGDLTLLDDASPGASFELRVPIEGVIKRSDAAPRSLGLDSTL
ncbi:MAG TPA: ATP-binding protein [Polyangiales bacterium]|nr:ATP-binding protein [Polyangiales bacterium]